MEYAGGGRRQSAPIVALDVRLAKSGGGRRQSAPILSQTPRVPERGRQLVPSPLMERVVKVEGGERMQHVQGPYGEREPLLVTVVKVERPQSTVAAEGRGVERAPRVAPEVRPRGEEGGGGRRARTGKVDKDLLEGGGSK